MALLYRKPHEYATFSTFHFRHYAYDSGDLYFDCSDENIEFSMFKRTSVRVRYTAKSAIVQHICLGYVTG